MFKFQPSKRSTKDEKTLLASLKSNSYRKSSNNHFGIWTNSIKQIKIMIFKPFFKLICKLKQILTLLNSSYFFFCIKITRVFEQFIGRFWKHYLLPILYPACPRFSNGATVAWTGVETLRTVQTFQSSTRHRIMCGFHRCLLQICKYP